VDVRDRGVILVVSDDEAGAADQLLTILVEHGYAIVTAPGDVARATAALADAPDLMVVDTELDAVEAFGLVADLRDAAFAHDLPVIFMAPAVDVDLRVRSLEAGDDVISTPLDDREVRARIARQVSVSKVRMAQRESEAKFRSAMESAIDAIIYADDRGRIRSWNSAATALFGHTEQEAMGRPLELIIPERFRDLHRAGIERVSAGGPTHAIGSTFEVAALRRDGGEFPVELSLATWFLGEDRYYTGIIRDISERKAAEEALRRSEQVLREKGEELGLKNAALEATLEQISQMQEQLILQEKMASLGKLSAGMAHELNNPASAAQRSASQALAVFAKLLDAQLGLGRLGLDEPQLDRLHDLGLFAERRAREAVVLDAVTRSDREAEVEDWLNDHRVASAGELAPALVSLDYTTDGLEGLAAAFDDDQLAVAVEWLGLRFLISSLLSEVTVGTTRIADLVKALKSYTYLDQSPVQEVDLRRGLEDTLIMLNSKLKGGVTVVREYADDLPTIQAYASELNQVWTNLIDNAVDAMDGQGTLSIRARRAGDRVEVEVEDDGPGIPAENLARLFDMFFTTKPPGEGTGLGLAISRNIVVNRHHGELAVESAPGRTRFTVRLPLDVVPTDEHRQD
jgi:PAS domain S-box-containing protein